MGIKKGSTNIGKIYLGTTEVKKVCVGDTEVWASFVETSFYPSFFSTGIPGQELPYTTQVFEVTNGGEVYLTASNNEQYTEVTWTKNGSGQGYLAVYSGSSWHYPNGRTFSFNKYDEVTFTFSSAPGQNGLTFQDTTNNNVVLTVSLEAV